MELQHTGTIAARLAALAGAQSPPQSSAEAESEGAHTLQERLRALQSSQAQPHVEEPVPVPGPSPPTAPAERKIDQPHAPSGHRYVPKRPGELLDEVKIGAALASDHPDSCCAQKCLSFWDVQSVLQFHKLAAKLSHREQLEQLLNYISHCGKSSRGYNHYVVEVSCDVRSCRYGALLVSASFSRCDSVVKHSFRIRCRCVILSSRIAVAWTACSFSAAVDIRFSRAPPFHRVSIGVPGYHGHDALHAWPRDCFGAHEADDRTSARKHSQTRVRRREHSQGLAEGVSTHGMRPVFGGSVEASSENDMGRRVRRVSVAGG